MARTGTFKFFQEFPSDGADFQPLASAGQSLVRPELFVECKAAVKHSSGSAKIVANQSRWRAIWTFAVLADIKQPSAESRRRPRFRSEEEACSLHLLVFFRVEV